MKFQKTVDIWDVRLDLKSLQRGQWVKAGSSKDASKGIFCGVRQSGSVVVAWYENAKNRESFRDYVKTLMNYGASK